MTSSVHRDWLTRHPTLPLISTLAPEREQQAVLACAIGRDLAEIAPFVRSLREVFVGQVILVVDRKPTLLAWLSTHGVEAVIAADRLPHWKPNAAVARFAIYGQLLQERREIRQVVLTDVRDVVFQADPFRQATESLEFFANAGGASPGAEEVRAIEALMGETLAQDLGWRARIVGLVAGPTDAVARFCRTLVLLCGLPRAGLAASLGQAACHVIAHLGLAGGEIRPNFQRTAVVSDAMRVEDGRILNPDDSASPIVVGYRRSTDMASHVDRRWGLPSDRTRTAGFRRAMRTLRASFLGEPSELR